MEGEKIGQGHFGKVVRADAYGICKDQDITTVAVKMLKANAELIHKKALFAELKMLIRLGRHLNVVSLLGAVTKHQTLAKLMIIVEYCEKGNLHAYLLRHRQNFICQVDQTTGKLDRKLCFKPYQKRVEGNNSRESEQGSEESKSSTHTNHSKDNAENTTSETMNEVIVFDSTPSDSSSIPEPSNDEILTTVDLIKFSYQCARGMEYISSRKLVHRDLSARNVLLTKDNIIKICDFGLSRDSFYLYNSPKKTPLPIRWMAPESLGQNQFTSFSDTWSFGILLWEMFTLGDTPYPGMPIDESFYIKLFSGYRLTPPDLAPNQMAILMRNCWQAEPRERPRFTAVVENLSEFLDDQSIKYYLTLNVPCEVTNRQMQEKNEYANVDGDLNISWLYEPDVAEQSEVATEDTSLLEDIKAKTFSRETRYVEESKL